MELLLALTLITPLLAFLDAIITLYVHVYQIRVEEKHDEKLDKISRDVFTSVRANDLSGQYQTSVQDIERSQSKARNVGQRNLYV